MSVHVDGLVQALTAVLMCKVPKSHVLAKMAYIQGSPYITCHVIT